MRRLSVWLLNPGCAATCRFSVWFAVVTDQGLGFRGFGFRGLGFRCFLKVRSPTCVADLEGERCTV